MERHLNDNANFDGRNASIGNVKNAMKKHTAAPIKQLQNPSSLFVACFLVMSTK